MQFIPVSPQDRSQPRSKRTATNPVRLVLLVGLLGSLFFTGSFFYVDGLAKRSNAQVATQEIAKPSFSVLNARRTPTTLSTTSRIGALRRAVGRVANRLPSGGCLRVDWLGQTLVSTRSDVSFIPASASKLITAAVALEVLGPEYKFTTDVFADSVSVSGLTQNIYIVGGGDPLLVTNTYAQAEKYPTINGTSLETLATSIFNSGIRQISESIVIVDNRYDQLRFVDQWPSSFNGVEAGPLGALMFNDATITGALLKPDDPGIGAGTELSILLSQKGIVVNTVVQRSVSVPAAGTKIATATSSSLSGIVQEMLVNSDNNTAEMLIKELGFTQSGSGSTASGLEVVSQTLKNWGLKSQPTVVDGSGLSSSNSTSCDFYVELLERQKETLPTLLAIAGRSGTLENLFTQSPVKDRLAAKTGTLTGVKALVGYLPLDEEEDIQFALILNASGIDNQSSYRPIWNNLTEALNFGRPTPRPEQLAP